MLRYRLTDSLLFAAQYFQQHDSELTSPYVRMLAAREVQGLDPMWATIVLRGVVKDADKLQANNLAIHARCWLAHIYRNQNDSTAARAVIDSAMTMYVNSSSLRGLSDATIEVRLRGERLAVLRKFDADSLEAEKELAVLADLLDQTDGVTGSVHDASALLNAHYWIGLDCLVRRRFADAKLSFDQCLDVINGEYGFALRNDYPYVCAMSLVNSARAALQLNQFSDSTRQQLLAGLNQVERLSGRGLFLSDRALCHLLLGEYYWSTGAYSEATEERRMASAIRHSVIAKNELFGYEEVWTRITRLLDSTNPEFQEEDGR